MNPSPRRFTPLQGQYLAFIHLYTLLHRQAPAEADLQAFFEVTPPSVHQMILTLERRGLISRQAGRPRSVRLLVASEGLPALVDPRDANSSHGVVSGNLGRPCLPRIGTARSSGRG